MYNKVYKKDVVLKIGNGSVEDLMKYFQNPASVTIEEEIDPGSDALVAVLSGITRDEAISELAETVTARITQLLGEPVIRHTPEDENEWLAGPDDDDYRFPWER